MTTHYMNMTEVAKYLNISVGALSTYKLPAPDATLGKSRGWLPETIETWNANRPGRGVGGGRPRKQQI